MQTISEDIVEGKFVDAIALLRLKKDASQGIRSHYAVLGNNKILIRDATQQTNQKDGYYDWAILGLNYVTAGLNLFESHNHLSMTSESRKEFDADLRRISSIFLTEIKNSPDREILLGLFIHQKLLPVLKKHLPNLSKAEIAKQLADIRDFGNFDHATLSVATKMNDGVDQVYQIDLPLVGQLTEKLKNDYSALADTNNQEANLAGIDWYVNQKPHIKFLMRKYAKDILAGKIIPTQLRKYFPGIRNGGDEYLIDINQNKVIQHHYHTGTPAHLLKKGSQEATNESVKQLKDTTGAQHVLVLTLLSPLFIGVGNDANLVRQVEKAVKECNGTQPLSEQKFHTSNIPLNWIRGVFTSSNQMSGARWLVDQAEKEAKKLPVENKVERDKIAALIEKYKYFETGSGVYYDPENRNLQLVSVLQQLGHALNEAHRINHPEDKNDFVAVVSSCQSGKDRAGLARIRTLTDAMKNYFSKLYTPKLAAKTEEVLINAGQVPTQAGFQGGTIGACGIKSDSKPASPLSWKAWKNILFKKTASYNKNLPKDPRKAKKSRNKKIVLALAGGVVGGLLCATGIGALVGVPVIAAVTVIPLSVALGATAATVIMGAGVGIAALATVTKGVIDFLSINKTAKLAKGFEKFKKNKIKRSLAAKKSSSPSFTSGHVEIKATIKKSKNKLPERKADLKDHTFPGEMSEKIKAAHIILEKETCNANELADCVYSLKYAHDEDLIDKFRKHLTESTFDRIEKSTILAQFHHHYGKEMNRLAPEIKGIVDLLRTTSAEQDISVSPPSSPSSRGPRPTG